MLRKYLEKMTGLYKQSRNKKLGQYYCIEDFVLQHGQPFEYAPLPDTIKRGKMKDCFRNSALLALENQAYRYVEGYASSIIPTHHAWCIDSEDRVVDNTWQDGKEYFGVVFDTEFLSIQLWKNKFFGLLDKREVLLSFKQPKN